MPFKRAVPPKPQQPQNGNDTAAVLKFAQDAADHELDRIEAHYDRAIRTIQFIVISFVAGFGALGFIGYENLRKGVNEIAKDVASKQVEQSAREQVRDKLQKEQLGSIVQQEVSTYAKPQLDSLIRRELKTLEPAMRASINSQTRSQLQAAVGPRSISPLQQQRLIESTKPYKGATLLLCVRDGSSTFDREVKDYTRSLRVALSQAGWKVQEVLPVMGQLDDSGLTFPGLYLLHMKDSANPDQYAIIKKVLESSQIPFAETTGRTCNLGGPDGAVRSNIATITVTSRFAPVLPQRNGLAY